jgi:hypothetical protein
LRLDWQFRTGSKIRQHGSAHDVCPTLTCAWRIANFLSILKFAMDTYSMYVSASERHSPLRRVS